MLLVKVASASSQLSGLDELSDHRKTPRDEQGNCALTSRSNIYRFVEVIFATKPPTDLRRYPDAAETGDFGNGLETKSLCDFGSFSLFAGNWPHGILGVLQHYLPISELGAL